MRIIIIVYYANKAAEYVIKSKLKYKNTRRQKYNTETQKKTSNQNQIKTVFIGVRSYVS